jgi:preprotein translocase subunit YajC
VFAAAAAGGGSSALPLIMIVLLFGVMYFMMIRPQQKRRREAQEMQSTLGPGDEIVTIGGLHATVVSIGDDTVELEISPGVTARYARPAIARVVPRATPGAATDGEPTTEALDEPVTEAVPDGPTSDDIIKRSGKD